jgi:hypothetical protein
MKLDVFQLFNMAFKSEIPAMPLLSWMNKVLQIDPVSVAENSGARDSLRSFAMLLAKPDNGSVVEEESKDYARLFAKESTDYLVQVEALKLIKNLGDCQALDLVLDLLHDSDVADVRQAALDTLLVLDPNLDQLRSQDTLLDLLKNTHELKRALEVTLNKIDPSKLLWLAKDIGQNYSDPAKKLDSTDLNFLSATRSIKAKIADYSEQLAKIAADYDYSDEDRINAVRILTVYFPEKQKDELAKIVSSLDGDPIKSKQILLKAVQNHTGEKPYPAWDKGVLKSGLLRLEQKQGIASLAKIGGLELSYKDSKPDKLSFADIGLEIQYFYNESGSINASRISYGNKDYSFVTDGTTHCFSHLSDMPEIAGASEYPRMKCLGKLVPDQLFVSWGQGDPLTIFMDGAMQLKTEEFTLQISSDGAIQIANDDQVVEFVTNTGEYIFVDGF